MKGSIPSQVISSPFKRPTISPLSVPRTIAVIGSTPKSRNTIAEIIPPKPRIDPTETSMPPARITSVSPIAMMPIVEVCCRMLIPF